MEWVLLGKYAWEREAVDWCPGPRDWGERGWGKVGALVVQVVGR